MHKYFRNQLFHIEFQTEMLYKILLELFLNHLLEEFQTTKD